MEVQVAAIIWGFIMMESSKWNPQSSRTEKSGRRKDFSRYVGVLVVVSIVGAYGLVRVLSSQKDGAQVKFVETSAEASAEEFLRSEQQLKDPFSGPEYDKAVRLREVSALGMAISLSVVSISNRTGHLPGNATEIRSFLKVAKLLPPGIDLSDGALSSERSNFHLAYRPEPFSFEVLASPKTDKGTQLLFRFPLLNTEPNSILYFEAFADQPKPTPLLSAEQLNASGWRIRHWRGDVLSLNAPTLDALEAQMDLPKTP